MKFSCTQENFERGLQLVSRIASKHTNLPILQNILLRAENGMITLSATNLEIGVQTQVRGKIDQPGSFTIPATLLQNYISLLPPGRIDCVVEGMEFHLATTDHSSRIKGEEATDFPILPQIEKQNPFTWLRSDFTQALQQVIVAASLDESRPEIAGIFFHNQANTFILAATDSYRLAEAKITLTQPTTANIKTVLPQRSAQELLRLLQTLELIELVECAVSENQLVCWCGDVIFVSRLIQGRFPDYEQIIPQRGSTTIRFQRDAAVKAIKSTALFSKTGVNDIEFSVQPQTQSVAFRAMNVQLGENTTSLKSEVEGEPLTIIFNHRFLIDGLQHMRGEQVEFTAADRNSPGLFRSTDPTQTYRYVIMPIKQ